jgi:Uncharacterized conserved protein
MNKTPRGLVAAIWVLIILITVGFGFQGYQDLQASRSDLAATPQATPASPSTISAQGEGQVTYTPDIAKVYMEINTVVDQPDTLANAAQNQIDVVRGQMINAGLADKDFQIVSMATHYQAVTNTPTIQYVQTTGIEATVRDLSKLMAIYIAGMASNANPMGITFDSTQRETLYQQAEKSAIATATERAKSSASAMGLTLGKVKDVQTTYVGYNEQSLKDQDLAGSAVPGPGFQSQRYPLSVTVDVNITWEMNPEQPD